MCLLEFLSSLAPRLLIWNFSSLILWPNTIPFQELVGDHFGVNVQTVGIISVGVSLISGAAQNYKTYFIVYLL